VVARVARDGIDIDALTDIVVARWSPPRASEKERDDVGEVSDRGSGHSLEQRPAEDSEAMCVSASLAGTQA
jgi:hypothetical protein